MAEDPQKIPGKILVGKSDDYDYLLLRYANRHGLVAGATGTGKTVTLQKLAEGFCEAGVSVFAADVKGDLSGIAMPGDGARPFVARAEEIGVKYEPDQFRCVFWDIFGESGHPVRATVAEMGPLLLSRILELNDTQEGVLNIAFRVADEQGLALLDMKDLRAILGYVSENASELQAALRQCRAGQHRRDPAAACWCWKTRAPTNSSASRRSTSTISCSSDVDGRGFIHILAADKLIRSPHLYATFLFWLLSELFAKPAGSRRSRQAEAGVLLRRGAFPVRRRAQSAAARHRAGGAADPLARASASISSPRTRSTCRTSCWVNSAIACSMRSAPSRRATRRRSRSPPRLFGQNPAFNTADVITKLKVGEALVSMMEESGAPAIVSRDLIAPPASRVGPITAAELAEVQASSPFKGKYDVAVDRESAFEILQARAQQRATGAPVGARRGRRPAVADRRGTGRPVPTEGTAEIGRPDHRPVGDQFRRALGRFGDSPRHRARRHWRDEITRLSCCRLRNEIEGEVCE